MRVSTSPLRLVIRIWPLPSKQTPLGRCRMRVCFACLFTNVGSSSSAIIHKTTQFGVWSVQNTALACGHLIAEAGDQEVAGRVEAHAAGPPQAPPAAVIYIASGWAHKFACIHAFCHDAWSCVHTCNARCQHALNRSLRSQSKPEPAARQYALCPSHGEAHHCHSAQCAKPRLCLVQAGARRS